LVHPDCWADDWAQIDTKSRISKLGFWLAFAEGKPPTFAGVNLGDVQVFLERGTPSPQGCSLYFVVNDADVITRSGTTPVTVSLSGTTRHVRARDNLNPAATVHDGDRT
jgi:hypothetical protein